MRSRSLGSTGIDVSEIVFGGGAVGGLMIREDRPTRTQALRLALDHGVNWFDTAPSYGDGQSEENIGSALAELGAVPHLSTKVSVRPEHFADLAGEIRRSVEGSLRRLRRDRVDMVILHNATTEVRGARTVSLSVDDVLGKDGVADGFERLRSDGLTTHLGFTAAGDAASSRRLIESGRFQAAQVFHSLVNPSAGRMLPSGFPGDDYEGLMGVAASAGVGVFNIRVLAAGSAAGANANEALGRVGYEAGAGSREATPGTTAEQAAGLMARVREVLAPLDGSDAQKAVRFALANTGVSGVLVGFSTLAHIDEAVAAAEMDAIPAGVMRELDALYASLWG